MPAKVSYPGVYVQEEASGAQAVAAASTSTALFVGMAGRGPLGVPTRVLSLIEYERVFGATSTGEMADQVRQFYVNGGTEAWIMRIANGPAAAGITVRREIGNTAALTLTARDMGVAGNMLRAEVDYDTASPERTFNLTVYRHQLNQDGTWAKVDSESFGNLSMDSGSSRYAPNIVNGGSALVTLGDPAPAASTAGMSIGGTIWNGTLATAQTEVLANITGGANGTNTLNISVNHRPPVRVVLPVGSATFTDIRDAINAALLNATFTEQVTVDLRAFASGRILEIASANGPVVITPGATNDITVRLMLGVAGGGVEIDDSSVRRPGPTGLVSLLGPMTGNAAAALARIDGFANVARNTLGDLRLTDPEDSAGPFTSNLPYLTGLGTDRIHAVAGAPPANTPIGTLANVRRALDEMVGMLATLSPNRWAVKRVGLSIALTPKFGGPNAGAAAAVTSTGVTVIGTGGSAIFGTNAGNAAAYSLGATTLVGKQTAALIGLDGTEPQLGDYQTALGVIESELDAFNIMLLPRAEGQTDAERKNLWGIASATAAKRRAILLVDPDENWPSIAAAEAGVAALKVGVETRNAAIYWPRVRIPSATLPAGKLVDPSGSIAGLMARTDTRSGVWTAPAGIEATIRGIVGLQRNMSDDENGVLNPKALNAIRLFPSGAVSWGARTMIGSDDTGNIDDKYIPVRRTMLFIEESLYRGLKFAVFRPNAEPLWSAIRLAAGSFMNGLMRQGAFASRNKLEAYYVLCDATTTTETDRNLGIVNVIVAFAPLKPAEFVVLTVKQIAGQVEI